MGNAKVVELLVKNGADVNLQTKHKTALDLSVKNGENLKNALLLQIVAQRNFFA